MNIKMNLIEECVKFVDNTEKQIKYLKILIILFAIFLCLFLFFVLFNYLIE